MRKALVTPFDIDKGKNVLIAGSYQNRYLREIIHYLKYRFIQELANPLADFLTQFLRQKFDKSFLRSNNIILVPVPLYPKKFRQRGFNQSELIARGVSTCLNLPVVPALKKIKLTTAQMTIQERSVRLENVKHTFACNNTDAIRGKIIFLIDDVITTGATMEECAKVLKQAGSKKIWKVAVAG